MSFLKTNTFHEPPRYDLGVIPCNDSTWLEIVVNKKYDNQVLYADCVRNKPPTDVGYVLRRYEQPYNCGNYSNTKNTTNKYYWKRPNCLYNDKIHYKHTNYLCNSLMTYHKQITTKTNPPK